MSVKASFKPPLVLFLGRVALIAEGFLNNASFAPKGSLSANLSEVISEPLRESHET